MTFTIPPSEHETKLLVDNSALKEIVQNQRIQLDYLNTATHEKDAEIEELRNTIARQCKKEVTRVVEIEELKQLLRIEEQMIAEVLAESEGE